MPQMLTAYRRVLGLPGAWAFSASGAVARMPISMVGLGIVLLVSSGTGSYSLAGSVSAAYLVANGASGVFVSRLVDRVGQHRVLPVGTGLFGIGLVLLMAAAQLRWPVPVPHLCAALAGAALPNIGACVRSRWSHLVIDKALLQTAFAIEGVVDEAVFIVGPTLVTMLATQVHPLAGLATAVAAAVSGTIALVVQRRTEPPPTPKTSRAHGRGSMRWAVLGPLTGCSLTMGVLFGGSEVATVAFSDEHGDKALSGVMLAIWAFGSLLAGLVTGGLRITASNATRFRWGLLTLSLLMCTLPFVGGFLALAGCLFLAGFAISPTLIASVGWVEETVPAGRLTEGITILTTALAAGVAVGAALVGYVVDRAGASASYWVPALAGLCGAAIAFVTSALGSRLSSSPSGSTG